MANMDNGGVKPANLATFKQQLATFYEDNRPLFEIGGILLIFSALLLTIQQVPNFLIWQCVQLLQFFSLTSALIAISVLVFSAMRVLLGPLRKFALKSEKESQNVIAGQVKSITIMLFPLLVLLFFLVTVILFLSLSYEREMILVLVSAESYLAIYLIAYILPFGRKGIIPSVIVGVAILFFWLIAPAYMFFSLFFPELARAALDSAQAFFFQTSSSTWVITQLLVGAVIQKLPR